MEIIYFDVPNPDAAIILFEASINCMKFLCLLLLFNLVTVYSFAQYYIEPIAGYSIDLNNKDYKFKQINSAIQFSWHTKSKHEWMLRVQRGWPLSVTSGDSSFSLNPAVPVYSAAKKDLRPASLSLAAGVRLKIVEINSLNILSALIYTGFTYQRIAVRYQYDKSNYTILNPDRTLERISASISGGVEYMHLFKTGRLFFQANVETPPVVRKKRYPSSFRFVAPLSINMGYSIPFSKK